MKALFTKLLCVAAAVLLLAPGSVLAQDGTISGIVTDGQTGDPLPGATVQVSELGIGTATDPDGNYEFDVPAGEHVVTASFVGYESGQKTITVSEGETTNVDFALTPRTAELDEVVVTAQNIERQAKSLGYSVTELETEDITKAKETNIVNSLQGKVPGLQITQSSGDVGAGSNVILRGVASLTGANQPLFVVDGVPIFNSSITAGSASGDDITGTVSIGNLAGDINPEDVKSVSVLKGGAASALYGSRARNGAIIITTKRGSDRPNTSVSVSSSINFSNPLRLPDFQNTYAQGDQGKYDVDDLDGWGPRIQGQQAIDFRDQVVNLTANPDNVRNFYETALFAQNSISFTNAGDFGDFRLSVTNVSQGGIVPESSLGQNTISFNAGSKLTDKIEARVTANYITQQTDGRTRQGANNPNVSIGLVNSVPRTISNSALQNYRDIDGDQFGLGETTNNPYWIINENPFTTGRERIFGSVRASYRPIEWVTVSGRLGTDYYSEDRESITAQGTLGRLGGEVGEDNFQERQVDSDFTVQLDRDAGEDFNIKFLVGHSVNYRSYQRRSNDAQDLAVADLYAYTNANSNSPTNFFSEQAIVGVYGQSTLGFRDYAFLEVTGRNDWSSTLPDDNNSYFYPSANVSLVFTDLLDQEFDLTSDILSYGKLRANVAQVGSDTGPYRLQLLYRGRSQAFGQFTTPVNFPFNGVVGFDADRTLPNDELEPEIQTSWEIGTELGLFNGRVNLDFTYYDQRTTDQIITLPAAQSSGFSATLVNVGELQNNGIELVLNATVLNFSDLVFGQDAAWRTNINFSRNDNKVTDLGDLESFRIETGFNSFGVRAVEGESIQLSGPDWNRDPETGQVIIDEDTGLRSEGDETTFGEVFPDFNVGFGNTISLGPVSISALIDWQQGGNVYSETVQDLRSSGLAEETVANRGGVFIDEGVNVTRDPVTDEIVSRRENTTPVQSMEDFWQEYTGGGGVIAAGVFDATYVKLREATVSVDLPNSLLQRTFLNSASLTFQGRNLLLLYSKIPHIDPEVNLFGASNAVGRAYEFNSLPSTRTFGVTLDVTF
jgi:TonB-linked SusC/RagA family outer membrane protein